MRPAPTRTASAHAFNFEARPLLARPHVAAPWVLTTRTNLGPEDQREARLLGMCRARLLSRASLLTRRATTTDTH